MASSSHDFISVSNISDLESFSISKLIWYLKTEFRAEYFKKAEHILVSRDEKLKLEIKSLKEKNGLVEDRYKFLETRVTKLEKETSELTSLESQLSLKGGLELELGAAVSDKKWKNYETKQVKTQSASNLGIRELTGIDSNFCTPVKGGDGEQVKGPTIINLLCKPLDHKKERKSSCSPNLGIKRSVSENVIEIIDSENESEGDPKENSQNNIVMRTCSSKKDDYTRSSCAGKYSPVSTLKRKRTLEMNSSDSEGDNSRANVLDGSDRKAIGPGRPKNNVTKIERSPDNILTRTCTTQKGEEDRSNNGEKHRSVSTLNRNRKLKLVTSGSEDDYHCVHDPDGSVRDTIDPEKGKADFTSLISGIRRLTAKGLKWQYEADMISTFEVDPKLCMRAICALYRNHMFEEKTAVCSLNPNSRGRYSLHEQRGTTLAKFLLDGSADGENKKSVKELEMHDPKGLEDCKRLATHYSKQLFRIYQNKEDPFFP